MTDNQLGQPNNQHPDVIETLQLTLDRFFEDDLQYVTKPKEWQQEAIQRLIQKTLALWENQMSQELRDYDPVFYQAAKNAEWM